MTQEAGHEALLAIRRHRMCASKQMFFSEADAMALAAERVAAGLADFLRAYRCPFCNGWHLTSKERVQHGHGNDGKD